MKSDRALEANAAGFASDGDDVFARIADRYDLLCDLFSLGMHRLWKRRMANQMSRHSGTRVLDVASGTGDIPLRLLRGGCRPSELMVTDISAGMLEVAKRKLRDAGAAISFHRFDAENLASVPNASIEAFSMSFGMKICNRAKVIREAYRVLKPGGAFYCLEASRIPWGWLHRLYLAYMGWCTPIIGTLATGGDRSAYQYLLRGIHAFPDQKTFAAELVAAGFEAVAWRNMTLGVVALHEAKKPN